MNTGTRISRQLWRIITVIWEMLTVQIGCPLATRLAVEHGSEQRFPPIRSGYSEQLHPSICMWGKKISHSDVRLTLNWEMPVWDGHEPWPSMPVGRPAPASTNIGRLDTRQNNHWSSCNPTKRRCPMCSAGGVTRTVMFKCVNCDVALCVDRNCFAYYTQKTIYKISFRPPSVQTVETSTTV
jgi:hypothetical protein